MRRSKRSTIDEATSPATPAANVYEETISPNLVGSMESVRMSCGPSGMTTMKSTIVVNCTAASTSSTLRSVRRWARCDSESASREGSALIKRAGRRGGIAREIQAGAPFGEARGILYAARAPRLREGCRIVRRPAIQAFAAQGTRPAAYRFGTPLTRGRPLRPAESLKSATPAR